MTEGSTTGERRGGMADGRVRGLLQELFDRSRLSPTQRRLARYVMDHPDEALFLSSVELARRVGVSQPSVTRLAVALGYAGYGELQRELRQLAVRGGGEEAGDGAPNKFQGAVRAEIENLRALEHFLGNAEAVEELGREFAASEPLCVLGLRVSAPLAEYFGYFAKKIHPDVRVLTVGGSVVLDALAQARAAGGGWVLCFLLPRHPRETLRAMSYARSIGLRVATVADRAGRIGELSDVVLPVGVGTRLVFDSQAAAMVLAGVLLEALSDAAPKRAQERLEEFERRAAELGFFETG
nr:MurR/RpiR family transcriptional regulator [Rubrobacter xylanophilus]